MLTTLAFLSATAIQTPPQSAKIVTASMFKNGYAIVTREIDAPKPGEYVLNQIPQAALGTLWFTTSVGTRLDSVVNTTIERQSSNPVTSLDGILKANVGKEVRLGVRHGDAVVTTQTVGTILSAEGDVVILKSSTGTLVLPKGEITSISLPSNQGDLVYSLPRKESSRAIKFKTSGQAGKIVIMSLERGMTWAPGYAVDVTDKKKLSLTAKATVLNDLDLLDDVEVRFITGFPNVPYAAYLDPMSSGQDVNSFIAMIGGVGGPGGVIRDQNMLRNRAGDMMQAQAPAPMDFNSFSTAMAANTLEGEQRENLFFYRQPNVTLKRGDRGYFVLFRMEAPYENLYTWDIEDYTLNNVEYRSLPTGPADVWHTLLFPNLSGQPLTTAAATTFQGGEIIGQDLMKYVPSGANAELRINKALDIRAEAEESEVSRERGAIKDRDGDPFFDLVTLKGTLQIANAKSEKAKVRIKKDVTGEVLSSDGATTSKTALGLAQVNPISRMQWIVDVEPKKATKLEYTYKLYVTSVRR